MSEEQEITTLEGLLEEISNGNKESERISIEAVVNAAGQRSFGPMLLIPGLIALSPLSGIPGVPTMVGLMVVLITGQLFLPGSGFWLPQFVLRRSISRERFEKALKPLCKVARFIDRLLKPRLCFLTQGAGMYVIAGLCLLLSLAAPFLELVPFVISGIGGAVTCFGLALIAHDGVLAALAFAFCIGIAAVVGAMAF